MVAAQHRTMIEAVENHMPEVVIVVSLSVWKAGWAYIGLSLLITSHTSGSMLLFCYSTRYVKDD